MESVIIVGVCSVLGFVVGAVIATLEYKHKRVRKNNIYNKKNNFANKICMICQ